MSEEQIKINAKLEYYRDYVEQLERDYDVIQEENRMLKAKITFYKNRIRRLEDDKKFLDKTDAERYRDMCIKLKREKEVVERLLDRERRKNNDLG